MNIHVPWSMPLVVLAPLIVGCGEPSQEAAPAGKDGWLSGSVQEQLDTVAKHLRGNDIVMIEVDWRLQKLATAGLAENWPDAAYQLKKMRLSMALGRERRPKRARSYDWFFATAFPDMESAVESEDQKKFLERFVPFVEHCNACHEMEGVPHFVAEVPPAIVQAASSARAPR